MDLLGQPGKQQHLSDHLVNQWPRKVLAHALVHELRIRAAEEPALLLFQVGSFRVGARHEQDDGHRQG